MYLLYLVYLSFVNRKKLVCLLCLEVDGCFPVIHNSENNLIIFIGSCVASGTPAAPRVMLGGGI